MPRVAPHARTTLPTKAANTLSIHRNGNETNMRHSNEDRALSQATTKRQSGYFHLLEVAQSTAKKTVHVGHVKSRGVPRQSLVHLGTNLHT